MQNEVKNRTLPLSGRIIFAGMILMAVLVFVFWYKDDRAVLKESCSAESGDQFTYEIYEGSDSLVNRVVIHVERQLSEPYDASADYGVTAMDMAGEKIALIRNSSAVMTSFDAEKGKDGGTVLNVEILVKPQLLSASDYQYLNANGLVVFGTINWKKEHAQDLSLVFMADGMECGTVHGG